MWYYTLNNQQIGPVEEAEIRKLVEAGTITHGTLVWTNGMANWLPIAQTPLAGLFGTMPPPVAMTVPGAVTARRTALSRLRKPSQPSRATMSATVSPVVSRKWMSVST